MDTVEKIVNLTEADIKFIKARARATYLVVGFVLFILLAIFLTIYFNEPSPFILVIGLVICAIPLLVIWNISNKTAKELHENQKRIITGFVKKEQKTVKNGKSSTTYYYVWVGTHRFEGKSLFDKYHGDERVEFHKSTVRNLLLQHYSRDDHSNIVDNLDSNPEYSPKRTSTNSFYRNIQIEYLSDNEIQKLNSLKNKRIRNNVIAAGSLAFLFFIITVTLFSGSKELLLILESALASIFLLIYWFRIRPLLLDCKDYSKNVVQTKISDKFQDTSNGLTASYLKIDNKKYKVNSFEYNIFKGDDEVICSSLKNSGILIAIRSAKSASQEIVGNHFK